MFKGRTILLDLAYTKAQYDKTNKNIPLEKEKHNENEETIENIDDENHNDDKISEENHEENEGKGENETNEQNNSNEENDETEKKTETTQKPSENLDNTVFFTNLPYQIEEKEFIKFGQNFGPLLYAKVLSKKAEKYENFMNFH